LRLNLTREGPARTAATKERRAGAEKKDESGTMKVELQNTPASCYGNSAFIDLSSSLFSAPVVRALSS
jgi:hypothetical protein